MLFLTYWDLANREVIPTKRMRANPSYVRGRDLRTPSHNAHLVVVPRVVGATLALDGVTRRTRTKRAQCVRNAPTLRVLGLLLRYIRFLPAGFLFVNKSPTNWQHIFWICYSVITRFGNGFLHGFENFTFGFADDVISSSRCGLLGFFGFPFCGFLSNDGRRIIISKNQTN